MTDKERLEKIRKGIELVDKHEASDRTKMVDFRHWSYELLKIAVEQAERAHELEQQNKNYRKAIKGCIERMDEGGAGTRSFVYEKLSEALDESK